jgi:hypothetical protein
MAGILAWHMDCNNMLTHPGYIKFAGGEMKIPYTKNTHRVALFFFFLLFNYFFMPSPSGGSLKTGAMIGATPFEPGAMLLLGSALIGLAAWGRKKLGK